VLNARTKFEAWFSRKFNRRLHRLFSDFFKTKRRRVGIDRDSLNSKTRSRPSRAWQPFPRKSKTAVKIENRKIARLKHLDIPKAIQQLRDESPEWMNFF